MPAIPDKGYIFRTCNLFTAYRAVIVCLPYSVRPIQAEVVRPHANSRVITISFTRAFMNYVSDFLVTLVDVLGYDAPEGFRCEQGTTEALLIGALSCIPNSTKRSD